MSNFFRVSYALALVALVLACVYGYVCNVVTLIGWAGDVTGEFVVRVIGLFIPFLGALMGVFA